MAYLKGYDVSSYQTPSDWLPEKCDFLIARASIAMRKDDRYDAHIAKAKKNGKITGAYHFNWDKDFTASVGTPREQARLFLQSAGEVDLLFLDVEGKMAFEPAESRAFIDEVHKAGKRIGLYMSQSSFRKDGQDYDWIALWGSDTPPSSPDGAWEFWQFTSKAPASDGGRLDRNNFNGTRRQLKALSNIAPILYTAAQVKAIEAAVKAATEGPLLAEIEQLSSTASALRIETVTLRDKIEAAKLALS